MPEAVCYPDARFSTRRSMILFPAFLRRVAAGQATSQANISAALMACATVGQYGEGSNRILTHAALVMAAGVLATTFRQARGCSGGYQPEFPEKRTPHRMGR